MPSACIACHMSVTQVMEQVVEYDMSFIPLAVDVETTTNWEYNK